MAVAVSIFNANTLDVTVQVNNGPQFTITGAAAPNFTPVLATTGAPTWSNNGPQPNILGPTSEQNPNNLFITPSGSTKAFSIALPLNPNMQWVSFQLYIFWNTNSEVNWIVLNNGQYVSGSVTLAASGR